MLISFSMRAGILYIIGDYNPSVRITTYFFTTLTLLVLILYIVTGPTVEFIALLIKLLILRFEI